MNPYAPPGAAIADPPAKAGSPIKALVLGLLVDLGGSLIGVLVLAFAYGIYLAASGAEPDKIAAAADPGATDTPLFYGGTLLGLGCSALGGYVCARIARHSEMTLGAVLAAVSAVLGWLLAGDHYQLGTLLSLTLASVGAVMVGAKLGYKKNRGTK